MHRRRKEEEEEQQQDRHAANSCESSVYTRLCACVGVGGLTNYLYRALEFVI